MKTIFIFILIVNIIFTSCNNQGSTKNNKSKAGTATLPYHIDLEKGTKNIKSVPLSTIGKKIEYIPLETNQNSLIGNINGIGLTNAKILFSTSFIFISDSHKLLQFDRSGKFIRQIGSEGKGPEEYIEVFDFCIDEQNEIIFILSARIMLEFDFTGQFRKSSKMSYVSLQFMLKDTNSLIFYLPNFRATNDNPIYSWYLTDLQGNPLIQFTNYHKRVNTRSVNIGWAPLYSFNGNIHSIEFGSDTLVRFKTTKPEPYSVFNLGSMKMDPDPPTSDVKEYYNRLNQKLWPRFINESEKYMFMMFWWGLSDSSKYCVFNKQNSQTTFLKNKAFLNDLDGGPSFWPRYIYNDSILVDFIYADKLMNLIEQNRSGKLNDKEKRRLEPLETVSKQLTETSNPVLMVVR